jgi:hypothetical protein
LVIVLGAVAILAIIMLAKRKKKSGWEIIKNKKKR